MKAGDKVGEIGKGAAGLAQRFEMYSDGNRTEDLKQNSE